MSNGLAQPHAENRLAWLREELGIARRRVDALTDVPSTDPWLSTRRRRAEHDLDQASQQLALAGGGGALRLRLSGESVHGHTIMAKAFTSVVAPLEALAEDFGGSLYVGQTQPGSYVVTLLPHPQLELLDGTAVDAVGDLLTAVIDAVADADVDASVEEIASDLSLDAVRALTALATALVDHELAASFTCTAPDGTARDRVLPRDASARLLMAFRNAQVDREQIEVAGELVLAEISRRPRFAIRSDDGIERRGTVPLDVARSQVRGISVGGRVQALLEVVRRRRSSTPTITYRLLAIESR